MCVKAGPGVTCIGAPRGVGRGRLPGSLRAAEGGAVARGARVSVLTSKLSGPSACSHLMTAQEAIFRSPIFEDDKKPFQKRMPLCLPYFLIMGHIYIILSNFLLEIIAPMDVIVHTVYVHY